MPTLPADPVAVEKLVRDALVALFSGIPDLDDNVIPNAVYIASEQEFAKRFAFVMPTTNKTEFRALFVVFIGYEDTDQGCEDNPVYKLVYLLRLIVSLVDKRPDPDTSTSTDTFAALVMRLRDKALKTNNLAGYEQLELEALTPGASDFGPEERETGLTAHSIDLTCKVEVTPTN